MLQNAIPECGNRNAATQPISCGFEFGAVGFEFPHGLATVEFFTAVGAFMEIDAGDKVMSCRRRYGTAGHMVAGNRRATETAGIGRLRG